MSDNEEENHYVHVFLRYTYDSLNSTEREAFWKHLVGDDAKDYEVDKSNDMDNFECTYVGDKN